MNPSTPYRFDHRGRTAESGDDDYLRDMIEAVLFTTPGERVMRPTFGSGVAQLVFAPNSVELAGATQMLAQGALNDHLAEWLTVRELNIAVSDNVLRVTVAYTPRGSDRIDVATFERGDTP